MADTGRVELLDLLHDQLISSKRIVRMSARTRALDSDAAYSAIAEAYRELASELRRAAALIG